MDARIFILCMMALKLIYEGITSRIAAVQRKKPLPPEVADVYDSERYARYLAYVADKKKAGLIFRAIGIAVEVAILFSGIYSHLEAALGENVYLICLATYGVYALAALVPDVIRSWYITFRIEEKYGKNKQTLKGFVKDEALEFIADVLISSGLYMLLVWIAEQLPLWTKGFTVSFGAAFLICAAVAALLVIFVIAIQPIGILVMKKRYRFTPLPEGELRSDIDALQAGCRKKVKKILVYDESSKSTSKNAFLLRFFGYREFGIADNFLAENAHDELLAVLSHEVGHLKHKRKWWEYAALFLGALLLAGAACLLARPQPVQLCGAWVRDSFSLSVNNYYLLLDVLLTFLTPLFYAVKLYANGISRCNEYEADRESVKNGYGEALIATFKRLSSDELVNVNPHPFIEAVDYNHPGMYRRIKAIRAAMARREENA